MTRMTHLEQEERLRWALRAAADSIEPAADGLERIRERLARPRPLAVAWLMAGWADLAQPVMLRIEPVWVKLAELLGVWLRPVGRLRGAVAELLYPAVDRMRPVLHRLRPTIPQHGAASTSQGPRYPWLRLAAAIGVIVVVAFVGGFVLTGLPHTIISQVQQITSSGGNGPGSGGHAPTVAGSGTRTGTSGSGQHRHASPSPSPSCSPSPSARKGSSSPSPAPTNTPNQPSPSASPTPNPTTPTPTPTQSPSSTSGSISPSPTSGQVSVTALVVIDDVVTGRPHQANKPSPTPTSSPSCSAKAS
jgi:hypothetical protein